MKISKRGAVPAAPTHTPTPPPLSCECMCVPSICQLLDLTLSACNVRGVQLVAEGGGRLQVPLNCFFYLPSVCGTMRHQMPQLAAHHCHCLPRLPMLLLIAIMPAVSSETGNKGAKRGRGYFGVDFAWFSALTLVTCQLGQQASAFW